MAAKSSHEASDGRTDGGHDIHNDMAALREDLSKLMETLKAMGSERTDAARAQVREAAESTKARAKETSEATAQMIEERPFTSVLIAFGIGILLGVLFDRRS
jgi:ElaB/YqjD/DUF883 family membrane-anchored ribosome-binding protein